MSEIASRRIRVRAPSLRGINWRRLAARAGVLTLLLTAGGMIALAGERLLGVGNLADNEVRIRTFMDWRLICPAVTIATPNCTLTSDTLRDTGGVLLTLSLANPAPGSQMSLIVPHGVMLESGLGFSIGTEPIRVRPYETCTAVGCIALVTVDADTLRSLSSNMEGQVAVAAPNSQQPVNIPFSLRGFADGYAELQRAQGRRTGIFRFLGQS